MNNKKNKTSINSPDNDAITIDIPTVKNSYSNSKQFHTIGVGGEEKGKGRKLKKMER